MDDVGVGSNDVAALEVTSGSARAMARSHQAILVGRDPTCQLVIDDKRVSRHHAEVSWVDGGWVVRDLKSTNGTFVDGERVTEVPVSPGSRVMLGSPDGGPMLAFSAVEEDQTQAVPGTPVAGRAQAAEYETATRVRIGRGPGNDIVLSDVLVSRNHAEVRRSGTTYLVVDLGSRNGTYHNGKQVPRAVLAPGDLISIGKHEFVFDGQRLHEYVDTGPTSLAAEDLTVQIGGKVLLDDVSFALPEGSLLALVGPSGCGKSTLLRALTGIRPATLGTVHYNSRDLYADYAELRYRIGMVPQDDVLHRQLTVRRALRFAASLRFADDVPRRERVARVDDVVQTLGLAAKARQRIDTLSGGQRKRASVAMELLTEPSLLCLDEPTSGLDPALDKEVMAELRELADRGRTVIVVTHNVLHLDMCDRIMVLCDGGRLGYFGPPERVLEFFEAPDYADVFAKATDFGQLWSQRFRVSNLYREYVVEPMISATPVPLAAAPAAATSARAPAPRVPSEEPTRAAVGVPVEATDPVGPLAAAASTASPAPSAAPAAATTAVTPPAAPAAGPAAAPPAPAPAGPRKTAGPALNNEANLGGLSLTRRAAHPMAPLRQFVTLSARMISVILADRGYALFLLGLPLALALLTHSVPGDNGLAPPPPGARFSLEAQRLLVVLVVGASFMGIAPAIREIVSEASIYRRERAVGLSAGAYLASKIAVFSIINVIQVAIFVYLALLGRPGAETALVLGSPLLEIMVPVALVAISCTVLGLCVSAIARTTEQTTPVLVVVVMTQLVLSGGLFELSGEAVLEQISWIAQTRWGFAAGASTVDLQSMIPFKDTLWEHTTAAWWRSILLLGLHIAILTGAARLALRRLEPGRQ